MQGRFSAPEPWRAKMVESMSLPSPEAREAALRRAGWNVFGLQSHEVFVDLLTDSGTGAMSSHQWAAMMRGDESYAGSEGWFRLKRAVGDLTGMRNVIPVHQGRGAETVYCRAFVNEGDIVLGNLHFDTTRAHVQNRGARPVDVTCEEGLDPEDRSPFKGNADLRRAAQVVADHPGKVRLFILTLTANTNGGQPVSLENAQQVARFCRRHGLRLVIDAARFAENAYLVSQREEGQQDRSIRAIARSFFDLADGVAMSSKKDAIVSSGGFLALRSTEDFETCAPWAVLYEGFLTYGGMAGRDLEALARGLSEGMRREYLESRIRQVRLLHELIADTGAPVVHPPGGHCVMVDAARFLEHLPRTSFPAEALAAALYLQGGVRAVGLGALAFGRAGSAGPDDVPPWEYLRLTVPRRVYTDNHMAYVAEVVASAWEKRDQIPGLRTVRMPEVLPHFTAVLEPEPV